MTDVRVDRSIVGDEDDAELTTWLLPDGAEVEAGQPIAEVTAAKATAEVLSPAPGRLRHLVSEGVPLTADQQIAVVE